jgi:hypothetical protein
LELVVGAAQTVFGTLFKGTLQADDHVDTADFVAVVADRLRKTWPISAVFPPDPIIQIGVYRVLLAFGWRWQTQMVCHRLALSATRG